MLHPYHITFASILAVAILLCGCGGSSNDTPNPPESDQRDPVTTPGQPDPESGGDNTDPSPDNEPPPALPQQPILGLTQRPANTTCVAGERPSSPDTPVVLEHVYQNLRFDQPLQLLQSPSNSQRWYVVEKPGRILTFISSASAAQAELVVDFSRNADARSEGGLLSIAFDPQFGTNRYVYLSYTTSDDPIADSGGNFRSQLSRFVMSADGLQIDPQSEVPLLSIDQPFGNHNGGQIAFGPDGRIYYALGDGGSAGDPRGNGQDSTTLLGSIVRIGVRPSADDLAAGRNYSIPADNPFAQSPSCAVAGCPEIYAYGFRNPWRFSFDRLSGALWAGDVGQDLWEEIDVVVKGGNFGWRCYEGNHAYNLDGCAAQSDYQAPVYEYEHPGGSARSVTGGYVYRGAAIPALTGAYLFGDFVSGTIWGLFGDSSAPQVRALVESGLPIVSFAQDNAGEIYVVSIDGTLYRLAPNPMTVGGGLAAQLSATGCADPNDPTQPAAGMIPYDINAAFWSDGAAKQRWLALPDGQSLIVTDDGDIEFPIGSVLRKDFRLNDQLIETRLLARHQDGGWVGYSYAWQADGADASLLDSGKTATFGDQPWTFPGRADCLQCHTAAARRALGPELAQLNRTFTYPSSGVSANQLATLDAIGLFAPPLARPPEQIENLPSPFDGNAPLAERARAYLHTNCSQCHRPGDTGSAGPDFRYSTALSQTRACDALPEHGDLGITDARLIAPGDPARSIVLKRMSILGETQMPPVGRHQIDDAGRKVISDWILGLQSCQ